MFVLNAALILATAAAAIDPQERRLTCAHLLQGAEALHQTLVEGGTITPVEGERTLIVPGFVAAPTKNPIARLWRRFDRARPVAVAIKPAGDALVFEIGASPDGSATRAELELDRYVEVPWFGVLEPDGAGGLTWRTPLPALPTGDVTKRALYETFKDAIDPMVKTGRLRVEHMQRAIVLNGTFEGRTVKVLRTLPETDSQFMVFDDVTKAELTPSPTPGRDQYIELADGRRMTTINNKWWFFWPRGLASEFAAVAKFESWKDFLGRYPEAIDSLPGLPFVSRDMDLQQTYVSQATDEDDGRKFLLVIMRRAIRTYGETPTPNYGLWDPEARAWVDVLRSKSRTFTLETRKRVGLHVNARVGWSELPPVTDVENFARSL